MEDDLNLTIRELDRRLSALEISGSPNLRERVARLEGIVNHINDPQAGVYPVIAQTADRLRNWAIVLLTALVINLLFIAFHFLRG